MNFSYVMGVYVCLIPLERLDSFQELFGYRLSSFNL